MRTVWAGVWHVLDCGVAVHPRNGGDFFLDDRRGAAGCFAHHGLNALRPK